MLHNPFNNFGGVEDAEQIYDSLVTQDEKSPCDADDERYANSGLQSSRHFHGHHPRTFIVSLTLRAVSSSVSLGSLPFHTGQQASVFVEDVAFRGGDMRNSKDYLSVLDPGKTSRGDIIRTVLGDENQVRMGDAISMYDHSDPLGLKHLPHTAPDVLRHTHDSLGGSIVDVSKMVDMSERNNGALARRGGMDCHERDDEVVPIDSTGGRSPFNDLAEHTSHES